MPGHEHDDVRLHRAHDFHFVLPDADRLDEHDVEAGRVEDVDDVVGRLRQAAEETARGHRADEDAAVGVELGHADAVAEDRAAGEGRRRVDGDDADALLLRAVVLRHRRDERRLARARRAGDADDPRASGLRIELREQPRRAADRATPRA